MASAIGKGERVSGGAFEGEVHRANEVAEVMSLLKKDNLEEVILLTDSPSATAVVPLLAKVRGVICRSGGMTSHLAIVSREFALPCVMGAETENAEELEGKRVSVNEDGEMTLA